MMDPCILLRAAMSHHDKGREYWPVANRLIGMSRPSVDRMIRRFGRWPSRGAGFPDKAISNEWALSILKR